PRRRVALRAPRRGVAVAAALGLALGVLFLFFLFFKFGGDDEPPPVRPAAAAPAPRPVREPRLADLLLRGHDAHVREWAAAWIEEHAEELARAGDYGTALGALGIIASGWPERTGLAGRLARLRAHRDAEPVQRALLEETIPNFERRRKPADGLAALARVEPTPHLAPAFAAARRRLEQQLAALDREPPVVELREGHSLEYARGTVAELSFRARDDYEVAGVRIFARPAGGSFRELPHTRSAFAYTVEIAPDLHGNGTVELYVVATDLSGHEGRLGSRERPLRLSRSEGFERMIGD
ncbi:MAG TPA: hypothetical protein VF121_02900, partial [Thermoanaerobaculia bacterium]|nr:hypothetical protein [Thermoanaerobaculia bacterium]